MLQKYSEGQGIPAFFRVLSRDSGAPKKELYADYAVPKKGRERRRNSEESAGA